MRLTWSVANEVAYMVVDIEVDKYANLVMDVASMVTKVYTYMQLTPFHLHQICKDHVRHVKRLQLQPGVPLNFSYIYSLNRLGKKQSNC